MHLLRVLCGGLPDRRDHAWAWIRIGFVQRFQSDLPEGANAGPPASTHGSEHRIQPGRRGWRSAGGDGAGKLSFETNSKANDTPVAGLGDRRLCIRAVVGRWSLVLAITERFNC